MQHTFIALFFVVSAFSLPSFGHDVVDEVKDILERALKNKKLFVLEDNKKRKACNFFEFNFHIPEHIDEEPLLVKQFFVCMRNAIEENDIVGPKRRPLVLIPYPRRYTANNKCINNNASSSTPSKCGNDFDFGGFQRKLGGL